MESGWNYNGIRMEIRIRMELGLKEVTRISHHTMY